MFWRFLPHATACIAAERLILLDIRQDRYFLVPAGAAGPMRAWLERSDSLPPPAAVANLLQRSTISRHGDPAPTSTPQDAPVPRHLLSPIWCSDNSSPTARLSVAAAVFRTRLLLRFRPLSAILDGHRRETEAAVNLDAAQVLERSAAFDRARTFTPIARTCLLDSLALRSWLRDPACRLVFGVTAQPFSAHCWLQAPHAVLNDSFDHVSRYAPILIR